MKYALAVAVVLSIAAPAFGQTHPVKEPGKSARETAPQALSDDFAKSALLALKTIQRDTTRPKVGSGQTLLVDRHTQELIDAADVAATTDEERSMAKVLAIVYLLKIIYNGDVGREDTSHGLPHSEIEGFSKRLDVCFADFEAILRARSTTSPATCHEGIRAGTP